MSKKRDGDGGLDRVIALMENGRPGLHDVTPPSATVATGLPEPLIELYARCDGMRMFHEDVLILPLRSVTSPAPGRWQFAIHDGQTISMDVRGRILRTEEELDDSVVEGTRVDRWLAGMFDAITLVYDKNGELMEDAFDDEGALMIDVREAQLRAQLRRDAAAPAPRWRLAHTLIAQDATDNARDELEQVVADDPSFIWAWLDLGRISEQLGDLSNAVDEMRMGAETAENIQHPQAGHLFAHLARLGVLTGDEMLRAQSATKASLLGPGLKDAQLQAVREVLDEDDMESAKELLELLRAVWPNDPDVLELAQRVA